MAKLDANLTITTGQGQDYLCSMSDNFSEVYQNINKVDNSDVFTTLATLSKTNVSLLKGSKLIVIKNNQKRLNQLKYKNYYIRERENDVYMLVKKEKSIHKDKI